MTDHLLVESQGPAAGPGCSRFLDDALALSRAGHRVWFLLVQEGVTAALADGMEELRQLADRGEHVWVDGLSLVQRGLVATDLWRAADVVDMDAVATKVIDPVVRTVWR